MVNSGLICDKDLVENESVLMKAKGIATLINLSK